MSRSGAQQTPIQVITVGDFDPQADKGIEFDFIGREIAGRYTVRAQIGGGGMADVYRATDEQLGIDVALKLLKPRMASDELRARMVQEAQAAAQVRHANLVRVFGTGALDSTAYIVMELLEGPNLEQYLQTVRGTQTDGQQPEARRPRSTAEWLMYDAEELRRRCGRLHGRLVGAPLPEADEMDEGSELETRPRGLVPVLSGLLGPSASPHRGACRRHRGAATGIEADEHVRRAAEVGSRPTNMSAALPRSRATAGPWGRRTWRVRRAGEVANHRQAVGPTNMSTALPRSRAAALKGARPRARGRQRRRRVGAGG